MAYTPSAWPAAQSVSVGVTAVSIDVTSIRGRIQKGILLLQRNGDSNNTYWSFDPAIATSTGVLVSKGDPGTTTPNLIPPEAFEACNIVYLIGGAASQTVDCVVI